jgi:hypothetical protein
MEGARTEPIYFFALRPGREAAIRLILVSNPSHKSHPSDVLNRLHDWARRNGLRKTDEGWIVIDRDDVPEAHLDKACADARQFGYHVAVSNPCFELWLWLHLRNNRPFLDRDQCQRRLAEELAGYEKGNYDAAALIANGAADAVQRALALDLDPEALWPKQQGTRVYRLVRSLLAHVNKH